MLSQDQVEIGVTTCYRLTINLIDAHSELNVTARQ